MSKKSEIRKRRAALAAAAIARGDPPEKIDPKAHLFKKGESKGRPLGVTNRMTRAAKEAFEYAFDAMGGAEKLAAWGKRHPTDFYRLYARLIPTDVRLPNGGSLVNITLNNGNPIKDANEAARVYAEIIGNSHVDLSSITYEPAPSMPDPSIVAEQPAPIESHAVPETPSEPPPDNVLSLWGKLGK